MDSGADYRSSIAMCCSTLTRSTPISRSSIENDLPSSSVPRATYSILPFPVPWGRIGPGWVISKIGRFAGRAGARARRAWALALLERGAPVLDGGGSTRCRSVAARRWSPGRRCADAFLVRGDSRADVRDTSGEYDGRGSGIYRACPRGGVVRPGRRGARLLSAVCRSVRRPDAVPPVPRR